MQGDLFAAPQKAQPRRARRSDPATSHDAAGRVQEFAGSHHRLILAALREFGQMGAEQIGAVVSLPAYSVRKRTAELWAAGQIDVVPGVTRMTSSGRMERVWRATA